MTINVLGYLKADRSLWRIILRMLTRLQSQANLSVAHSFDSLLVGARLAHSINLSQFTKFAKMFTVYIVCADTKNQPCP